MASRISDMINPQAARFGSGTFYQHYHIEGQYPGFLKVRPVAARKGTAQLL
jgi:hypothetical protein